MAFLKKIAITGASGFIGSSVNDHFKSLGFKPIIYECDLSSLEDVKDTFSRHEKPDVLIHLAGRFSQNYDDLIKNNLNSTLNILNALSSSKTHFIFSSTGAVYGNSGNSPVNEEYSSNINTMYGLIKLWCEEAIIFYANNNELNYTILRFPSVYGRKNNKGIIFNWLNSIDKKNEIIINGSGKQRRSFLNVDDISLAIEKIINNGIYGTFNLSHHENFDLNELASLFKDIFSCKVVYRPADQNNNLDSMVLDSSLISKELSWEPSKNIESFINKNLKI